jgi:hypothetical protein
MESEQNLMTLWSSIGLTLAFYGFLLIYGTYNCYKFLCIQQRYRQSGVLCMFYALSITLCLLRVLSYTYLIFTISTRDSQDVALGLVSSSIGDIFMASLGLIQVFTMVNLAHSLSIIYLRREPRTCSSLWLLLCLACITLTMIGLFWLVSL